GAALEEQVEQPAGTEHAGRAAEQRQEARLVQADSAGSLDGLADALRDRAAGPELPGRIEPLVAVANGEELAAIPELLDLVRVDSQPAREPGAGKRSGECVVH